LVTSRRTATHAESLLVSVTDRDGNRGWGESPRVYRVTGESVASAKACGAVARVRRVRDAVGDGMVLRLDANQGWSTPKQAASVMTALESAGVPVELVEQPVPAHDLAGMAFVTARIATPVLADESVYGPLDLVRLFYLRAADMVTIKLAKCGGLGEAAALIRLAHAAGMTTMVGSMMETHVGVGAAASLVAGLCTPAATASWSTADLDAAWWLARSSAISGASYAGDNIVLPDVPGHGITGLAHPLDEHGHPLDDPQYSSTEGEQG
jgi:L-Ala-D/L-Glu epimerase / N-acetyl-D-glutamate racemase